MDEFKEGESPNNTITPPVSEPSTLKQIRTFQGDVASILQNQKESLYSIQHTEQLKRISGGHVPDEVEQKGGGGNVAFYLIGTLILLFLGTAGAWFGYQEFMKRSAPPIVIAPANRFISVQDELEINFASTTRSTLISAVNEKSAGVAPGTITHIILRAGSWKGAPLATTADFLKKLQSLAPSNLIRAFDPLFMLGTVGDHRFLIIKINSFENAFPGMLTWEGEMPNDIGDLFATGQVLKTIPPNSVFKDVVSKNRDVRVLANTGTTTEPLLLYAFFENKMLIITDSLETLQTLVDHLTRELLSR